MSAQMGRLPLSRCIRTHELASPGESKNGRIEDKKFKKLRFLDSSIPWQRQAVGAGSVTVTRGSQHEAAARHDIMRRWS
jgi:hypothetical protein